MTHIHSHRQTQAHSETQAQIPAAALGAFDVNGSRFRLSLDRVPIVVLVALLLIFAFLTRGFISFDNLRAVATSAAVVGLAAVGGSFITIGGALFSLSTAVVISVTAMLWLSLLQHGVVLATVVSLLFGIGSGLVQGVLVGLLRANPIIVTIAFAALLSAAAGAVSGGATVVPGPGSAHVDLLGRLVGQVPVSVYLLAVVAILAHLVLKRTTWGSELYAVGASWDAARAAGLGVGRAVMGAFMMAGATAAIAGMVVGSVNQNATIDVTGTVTFDAVAAIVVGGVAITGGRGTAIGAALAAVAIAALDNMLVLRGYGTGTRLLVKGVVLLIFILAANYRKAEASR